MSVHRVLKHTVTAIACSDELCAEEDSCPLDSNNDVDNDGVCGDVDT